jgi:hypothetical protein
MPNHPEINKGKNEDLNYFEYRLQALKDERDYFAERLKLGELDYEYCLTALRDVIQRLFDFTQKDKK